MATKELVTEQFQYLGIEVENEVLEKCVSLCEEYNVDAETFVELWMAYSLTHHNGAQPSLETIALLERKEFSKRSLDCSNDQVITRPGTGAGASLKTYNGNSTLQPEQVLSNYMTGKAKEYKLESTSPPHPQNQLCPATYSPTVSHSTKYTSRTNAGAVVHSYGDEKLLEIIAEPSDVNDNRKLNINQIQNDDGDVYTKAMLGFELLHEKASIYDNHIRYLSQYIKKNCGLSEANSPVLHKTQTEVLVAGRIECDADARLNPKSVMLQATWEDSLSQAVPVDLDNLKQYSLFPGQVVVMRGANPRGDTFVVNEIYQNGAYSLVKHKADINILNGTLKMCIAAGPYTTTDNMAYEPLKDLITYITTYRPHVVLLTGPFIDCDHTMVKENSLAETYKSFFEKLIDNISEINNRSPLTKVYIVSSWRDPFHMNIYPTPPYSSRRKHANIFFVPDPCCLDINGVVVGVTSTDVLMQISQEEISLGMSGDKLSRLAGHVLQQQSFNPRWPPPLPTDAGLNAAYAQLPRAPHVLVLPSSFRYFIKDVNGCTVVNPEHLSKGMGAGTFARLTIFGESERLRIAGQIVRI